MALAFFDEIATAIPEGRPDGAHQALGNLVASATNQSFAVGVYLKALRHQIGLADSRTHDLGSLFEGLPSSTKAAVAADYDQRRRALPRDGRGRRTVALSETAEPPMWQKYDQQSESLEPMLKRSGDVFSSWPYVLELGMPEGNVHRLNVFEYRLLDIACEAIKVVVRQNQREIEGYGP